MSKFIFCILLTLQFGCAATPDKGSENVRVMKNDPSSNCKDLGVVTAESWGTDDNLRTLLKNLTAEKGGNFLRLDESGKRKDDMLYEKGTVFHCTEKES